MAGPLLAVDAPWLLYRSHFGLPRSIRGTGGMPVGALLGTVNTILALVEWCAPRAVLCCMGAEEAAYRVALYPRYHAHRDPMPDELRAQWERAPALLESLGWHVAASETLEADDLLWSCSRRERAAGGRTLICSADRDLYQTVDAHTAVIELRRGGGAPALIDAAGVRERAGVEPGQIPDLIALRGDPSDGLPGAPGIGAKTAAELLRLHGTLDGVLAARDLRPRLALALREHAGELRTFRRIATLQDVELEWPRDAPTDRARGADAARELGLNALARRLEATARDPTAAPAGGEGEALG